MKPCKFKIHFNRINMQRGNPNVWTVHTKGTCLQVEKVVVDGGTLETIFDPEAQQPRAYFSGKGVVKVKGTTAYVTCV